MNIQEGLLLGLSIVSPAALQDFPKVLDGKFLQEVQSKCCPLWHSHMPIFKNVSGAFQDHDACLKTARVNGVYSGVYSFTCGKNFIIIVNKFGQD